MKFVAIKNIDSYEYKIINELPKDYFIQAKQVKDGVEYDIEGTQKIEEYYKKINEKDLVKIIETISNMLYKLENYLIGENSVDLQDVRVDENGNLKFIIIPEQKADFSYELSKFLIKVLRYIDVSDKEALDMAYKLFVESSKKNYTINDLIDVIKGER